MWEDEYSESILRVYQAEVNHTFTSPEKSAVYKAECLSISHLVCDLTTPQATAPTFCVMSPINSDPGVRGRYNFISSCFSSCSFLMFICNGSERLSISTSSSFSGSLFWNCCRSSSFWQRLSAEENDDGHSKWEQSVLWQLWWQKKRTYHLYKTHRLRPREEGGKFQGSWLLRF